MPDFPFPVGTRVVVLTEQRSSGGRIEQPAGSVAEVVQSPVDACHAYRVRFNDQTESTVPARQICLLSHYKTSVAHENRELSQHGLFDRVIFRCVVGSKAFGLDHEDSDTDRRGIYLPTAKMHWSLLEVPEQLENDQTQEVYWELKKFLSLALKANPNVLECLYSPLVEYSTPLAQELLALREAFLSKLLYQTYNGYVLSQFKKIQADLRNHGQIKWKHVMHLIRLLLSGIEALREGTLSLRVDTYRTELLQIRDGHRDWTEIDAWREQLHRQFDEAFRTTTLPDQPDFHRADRFLVHARELALDERKLP